MKKVFLFGSGDGARQYLLKHQGTFELLGLLDNNKEKQGKLLDETFIIYDPLVIKTSEFDEIIIVSQWAQEIFTQLTTEFNISSSKIVVPPKKEIKKINRPFEDAKTRELARMIVQQLSFYAIKENIFLLIDFGTLLGLVRDDDIIEWDDDVDFSLVNPPKGFNLSLWFSSTLSKINLPVTPIIYSKKIKQDLIYINFTFKDGENGFKTFITSVSFRTTSNGYSLHLPSAGMWHAPEVHFNSYETLQWRGAQILAPYAYREYLTFLYGDWQTPKKDISMCDYANLGTANYDDYKNLGLEAKGSL